jgi:hypothetical protein
MQVPKITLRPFQPEDLVAFRELNEQWITKYFGLAQYLLAGLAEDLVRTGVGLIHCPIIYYFYAANETASFPKAIGHLIRFAEA